MKMHDPADDEQNRLPYDDNDLMLIFNSPVFRSGERPRAGGGEAARWLPLLALFCGARLEEIGQALVSDVKEQDGIAYLDINTLDRQARKRVKNKSSRRRLPLHPELLRCGLTCSPKTPPGVARVRLPVEGSDDEAEQIYGRADHYDPA
jgi:integrase